MAARVEQLLDANAEPGAELWRARDFARVAAGQRASGIGTGFAELDAALFERGWPRAGLMELLSGRCGPWRTAPTHTRAGGAVGNRESLDRLGRSAFRAVCASLGSRWHRSRQAAAHPSGRRTRGCLGVGTGTQNRRVQRSTRLAARGRFRLSTLRRLAIAARQGDAWATLFRPAHAARRASGAELRLRLSPLPRERLHVEIVKRHGGWPLAGVEVGFAEPSDEAMLAREEPMPAPAAAGGAASE